MFYDRFDICDAWYLFLSEYHEGQFSEKYSRLSCLLKYYSPAPSLYGVENLTENGQEIYQNLVDNEENRG